VESLTSSKSGHRHLPLSMPSWLEKRSRWYARQLANSSPSTSEPFRYTKFREHSINEIATDMDISPRMVRTTCRARSFIAAYDSTGVSGRGTPKR